MQDNDIEIHANHDEGKSVVTERFIKVFKNKFYKCITSVSKIHYADKLKDIVNKYNNKYYITIKMKTIDVKSVAYIDSEFENDDKDRKCEVGDQVRKWKYIHFYKIPYWKLVRGGFIIRKLKNTTSRK